MFADLTEALPEGSRDFSIQDLQNRFYIFSGSISAQIAGKQAEEVCEDTHTHKNIHSVRREFSFITGRQAGSTEDERQCQYSADRLDSL